VGFVSWLVWVEALLVAAALGFGVSARRVAPRHWGAMRTVHLVIAVFAVIGMVLVAIVVSAVVR
jgi:hypothetical protein